MSFTRRLAAGLPAVGVTALAALAFAGAPASATPDEAGRPAVMATPCSDDARTKCVDGDAAGYGYGEDDDETPNDDSTGGADDNGSGDDNGGDDNGSGDNNGGNDDDDRGNPGYGGESPAPSPSETTPTGTTDTVPPGGGESPATTPSAPTTPGGGVSAGGTLPVTGAPMGATLTVGAVLVAGGVAAVWYTRRRREA
jgi:LPXTG-motif cell wall-anchored protein